MTTQQIPLRDSVDPLTEVRLTEDVLIDGKIVEVIMHFPSGCASLVYIAVNYDGKRVVPYLPDQWIALDDATVPFMADKEVKKGKKIDVIMRNYDGVHEHTPSVIVTVTG